jgi:hypothetical protein
VSNSSVQRGESAFDLLVDFYQQSNAYFGEPIEIITSQTGADGLGDQSLMPSGTSSTTRQQ